VSARAPRVELRRERFTAELLDPRHGFERIRLPLEIRRDPLTGQSCRLLPEGSLTPPELQDLEELAEQTRPTCPFCPERIESVTPRFPPELWPEGRICCGEALLFPNLAPYSKWSSVSVYSPQHHLLRLDELTRSLLADNLMSQVTFARAVLRHDPSSQWDYFSRSLTPAPLRRRRVSSRCVKLAGADRPDRTQEVAGSSPASSTSKRPAQRAFCFSWRTTSLARLARWSSFGQAARAVGLGIGPP
jgi:hypothetical protein